MSTPRHPLVLIPGLLCDATVWPHQQAALADIADIHVSDHGTQVSLPALARTILANAPPRYRGIRWAGDARVYRAAPERISELALMDTGHHPLAPGAAGEKEVASRFAAGNRATGRHVPWPGSGCKAWCTSAPSESSLVEPILDMFEAKSPEVFGRNPCAQRPDAGPVLSTIRCPRSCCG
jgi:hypothetical protein